jgi:Novel STAND NTPase 1
VPATVLASELPGLPFLSTLDRIEAPVGADDEVLHRLLAALKGGGVAAATPLWKLVNPYRGLFAMAEENADYFYGRESETQAALNVLAAKPNRIPILIGASGVGKSSVAQAGVLSALKSMRWPGAQRMANSGWPDALRDSRAWAFITMRPRDAPLRELAAAFIQLWQLDLTDPTQASKVDEWTEGLRAGRNS